MSYRIRILLQTEVETAMALVKRVFMQFEAPEYSAEGVAEFLSFIEPATVRQKMESQQLTLWGCFEEEQLLGVFAMRPPCHISLLFVEAAAQRRGIARRLFETMLRDWQDRGFETVTVNSSPYAVEVYRKLGFTPTDTEQTVHGIRFTPMRRPFLLPREAPYLKLDVRLSARQYRQAARQYLRLSKTIRRWEAPVCWITLAAALAFTILAGFKVFNLVLMLLSLAVLACNSYLSRWRPAREARRRQPRQMRLSAEGLQIEERGQKTRVGWQQLRRHYQSKEYFFFEQAPRRYWILPKRLLTEEQQKQLVAWLQDRAF